jgi:zinc protease
VVGDVTMEQLLPLVEQQFGSWEAPEQPVPVKAIATVDLPPGPRLLLIDKPDAAQSVILAAHVAPPTGVENNVDIFMMNGVLGSDYLSRINQNLRVDKHWSYGAYTLLPNARGQRPFMVYAPVETAHTVDAVRELVGEIERFVANDPARPDELERVYRSNAYALPGQFESSGAIIDMLEANVRFGRPDDYADSLKTRYEQVQLESLQAAADEVLHPDRLTWVIVGDRLVIEQELRELNLAEVELLDGEGQPLTP